MIEALVDTGVFDQLGLRRIVPKDGPAERKANLEHEAQALYSGAQQTLAKTRSPAIAAGPSAAHGQLADEEKAAGRLSEMEETAERIQHIRTVLNTPAAERDNTFTPEQWKEQLAELENGFKPKRLRKARATAVDRPQRIQALKAKITEESAEVQARLRDPKAMRWAPDASR